MQSFISPQHSGSRHHYVDGRSSRSKCQARYQQDIHPVTAATNPIAASYLISHDVTNGDRSRRDDSRGLIDSLAVFKSLL